MADAPTGLPPARDDGSERCRSRRVLVADDNVDAADTIALLLSTVGCDVHTVYGGEDAVRAADRFRPEIALLDLGMPDLDGWEVCRRIRAQTWGAGIRIVALTGWGCDDDRLHTAIAGFDEHVVKPADPDAVIRLVRDAPSRQVPLTAVRLTTTPAD